MPGAGRLAVIEAAAGCDNVTTIPTSALGEQIGTLLDRQEQRLSDAICAAFDLD